VPSLNRTIQLLDQLEALGFTNADFQALHHRGKATTIRAHRKYIVGLTQGVQLNGTNAEVERRLEQKLRELQSKRTPK
jgi:hypothetical protein